MSHLQEYFYGLLDLLPGFAWVGQRTGRANCLRHARKGRRNDHEPTVAADMYVLLLSSTFAGLRFEFNACDSTNEFAPVFSFEVSVFPFCRPSVFPTPLGCLSGAQPFSTAQSASSSVSSLCRGKKVDSIVFSLTAATQTSSVNFEGTWTNWAPTLHRGHTRCRRILPISSLFVYFDTPSRSQI